MMMQLKEGKCPVVFTAAQKKDVEARLAAYVKAHPESVHYKQTGSWPRPSDSKLSRSTY